MLSNRIRHLVKLIELDKAPSTLTDLMDILIAQQNNLLCYIWPASREKGPSDITNSVDPDQLLHDIENSYT